MVKSILATRRALNLLCMLCMLVAVLLAPARPGLGTQQRKLSACQPALPHGNADGHANRHHYDPHIQCRLHEVGLLRPGEHLVLGLFGFRLPVHEPWARH